MTAPGPDRWNKLWRQVTAKDDPLPIYQELVALYSQPHRHYHNLRHIAECLTEFDSARNLAHQPVAVELAIWLHDAIYDTHAQDNEEQSAGLARRRISEAGGDKDLCASVIALIMATKRHDASLHPDAPLLIDVDLSILGRPEERFLEYEAQIRREYEWVPEENFALKRAEILKCFLARKHIYATDAFFGRFESEARRNLQNSLRQLTALGHRGMDKNQ
jgi:predicted metal-dependent HD superfamily phosphohydrolase